MYNAFPVSHQVVESVEFVKLPMITKYLYIYLSKLSNRYADKNGWFWVSNKTLADNINATTRSIIRAKKQLKENGFLEYKVITFDSGSLKATIYRINHYLSINQYSKVT